MQEKTRVVIMLLLMGVILNIGIFIFWQKFISPLSAVQTINPAGVLSGALDTRRKRDIIELQHGLKEYYKETSRYPDNVEEIVTATHSIITIPNDPQTNIPYPYNSIDSGQSYSLCAAFGSSGLKCFGPNNNP